MGSTVVCKHTWVTGSGTQIERGFLPVGKSDFLCSSFGWSQSHTEELGEPALSCTLLYLSD